MKPDDIECKASVWLCFLGSGVFWLSCVWWLSGCVARSEYVDRLAQSQYETSSTLANVAAVQANMATELGSAQAPEAFKQATIAEIQAANSADLASEKSGPPVNIGKLVTDVATGNWAEVGMGIIMTAMTYFGIKQNGKLKQTAQLAQQNRALAEEVADLEPVEARKVLKARKPS